MQKQRIWNGMGWTYNPLPARDYVPAMEKLREALAQKDETPAVALTATEQQVMHRALRRSSTKIEAEKTEPVRYMAPGDRQFPRWLLTYDDVDRVWSVFEDGADALETYERSRLLGWNCYLWGICAKTTNAPAALPDLSDEECDDVILRLGLSYLSRASEMNRSVLHRLCRDAVAAARGTR
jgi:hypothetical protein